MARGRAGDVATGRQGKEDRGDQAEYEAPGREGPAAPRFLPGLGVAW